MSSKQEILDNHIGLNFNLLGKDLKENDILNKTLKDRGVKDIEHYADPQPVRDFKPSLSFSQPLSYYLASWFNDTLLTATSRSDKPEYIYILVDNDADGFTSAAFMYKYLKAVYDIKPKFFFTPGKNHGIKTYDIKNRLAMLQDIGMLIIPDASLELNDIDFLKRSKIPYLIIDHHDLKYQSYDRKHKLHIFNNQWHDSEINKEFTGVGMVFNFCVMLDALRLEELGREANASSYKYLYLLSIGQIGDVSDVADPEIRYYVLRGFKQMVNNELLKLTTDTDRLSAHELSFSIIPKINAVCRTGSLDDKRDLLNALVDNEPKDLVDFTYRRKSKVDGRFHKHHKNVSHYFLEAKSLNRIKSRQKRAVKKSLKALKEIHETKSFIIAVDPTGKFKQEEAGLIATQLSHRYQKPTMVLRTCGKPGYYKGSARGDTQVMKDFKKFCNQTQKFVYALGHPNAFGVMISDDYLKQLLDEYKNVDLNDKDITYNVDNVYLDDVPSKKNIVDFDSNRDLFGGSVKEPLLGFAGLEVKPSNIKFYGSVFTMTAHGLKFIMFNAPSDLYSKILAGRNHGDLHFDVVGMPDINRFMKYHYPQIIINNLKLVKPLSKRTKFKNVADYDNFYF